IRSDDSVEAAHAVAHRNNTDWVIVLDEQDTLLGWLDVQTLTQAGAVADCPPYPFKREVGAEDSLRTALNAMVANDTGVVPRLDAERHYEGLLTHERLSSQWP